MKIKRFAALLVLGTLPLALMAVSCPPPGSGGSNPQGGTTPATPTDPVAVTQASVAMSQGFACYVSAQGNPSCWKNEYDVVGTNDELFGGRVFSSIDIGNNAGCALTVDNKVLCFNTDELSSLESLKLATIKIDGPNPRIVVGLANGKDALCTLSGKGAVQCHIITVNGWTAVPPEDDLVDISSNIYSYGIKSDGSIIVWGFKPPDDKVLSKPATKIVLERYRGKDSYGVVRGLDNKGANFYLRPPEDYPLFEGSLLLTQFKDITVLSFERICGIKAEDSIPICFELPLQNLAALTAQQISQKSFTQVSLGMVDRHTKHGLGCGIEAATQKLFCWRMMETDKTFPVGVPDNLMFK